MLYFDKQNGKLWISLICYLNLIIDLEEAVTILGMMECGLQRIVVLLNLCWLGQNTIAATGGLGKIG